MKKCEIIKLINANRTINKNYPILSMLRGYTFNKEHFFPEIEELKDEFDILGDEIQSAIDETNKSKIIINNSKCEHEIRIKRYGEMFGDTTCVLCNENNGSDRLNSWFGSDNRNKYCVKLLAMYHDDEERSYIKDGYTEEKVYEIILKILENKNDDDDIDLVQEFKKLKWKLRHCEINDEKKVNETFILIIGGSNKQYFDNDSYLYTNGMDISIDFAKYFSGFLNTKIEVIENKELLESKRFRENFPKESADLNIISDLRFISYSSLEELKKILGNQKDFPFNLIIDISDLFEYDIGVKNIKKNSINLELEKLFPDSKIVRIGNLSKKSLEQLSNFLKSTQNYDIKYAYNPQDQKEAYHYLEQNEVKNINQEDVCTQIVRLLKK